MKLHEIADDEFKHSRENLSSDQRKMISLLRKRVDVLERQQRLKKERFEQLRTAGKMTLLNAVATDIKDIGERIHRTTTLISNITSFGLSHELVQKWLRLTLGINESNDFSKVDIDEPVEVIKQLKRSIALLDVRDDLLCRKMEELTAKGVIVDLYPSEGSFYDWDGIHLHDTTFYVPRRNEFRRYVPFVKRLVQERRKIEEKLTYLKMRKRHLEALSVNEASETPHKHILWVDDLRWPPAKIEAKCDIARTYNEAIQMLSKYKYTDVHLDHDLGDFSGPGGREMTGYDIIVWLADRKFNNEGYVPINYHILTDNGPGRSKIEGVINRYFRS